MASEYTSEWCIVEGNLVTLTNDGKSSKSKMNTEPLFVECEGKQGEDALRVEGHELKDCDMDKDFCEVDKNSNVASPTSALKEYGASSDHGENGYGSEETAKDDNDSAEEDYERVDDLTPDEEEDKLNAALGCGPHGAVKTADTDGDKQAMDEVAGVEKRQLLCPVECVGRLIGKSGVTVRNLQLRTGIKIQIDQDVPAGLPRKVILTGDHLLMDTAEKMVREVINFGPPETNRRNVYSHQNAVAYDNAKFIQKQEALHGPAFGMPNMTMPFPFYPVHPAHTNMSAHANIYSCYAYNPYMAGPPQPWTEHWSEKGKYFYNHETGVSSWAVEGQLQ